MKTGGGHFWGDGYVYGIDGDDFTDAYLSLDSSNCMH